MNASQLKLGHVERWLRRCIIRIFVWALGIKDHPTCLAALERKELGRIAVLRLDARLGNQVLQVPLLRTVSARFHPKELWAIGPRNGVTLLENLAEVTHTRVFDKFALGAAGIFRLVWWLRRQRFDLIIDASNPTAPSLTHAIIARLSGAKHTLGSAARGLGTLRSLPSEIPSDGRHEIDLRLALLAPLGPGPCERRMALPPPKLTLPSDMEGFLAATLGLPLAVINVGARLREKQLLPADYAALCQLTKDYGLTPVIAWGPKERLLAEEVIALADGALLSPLSNVDELCALFLASVLVLCADTGPMHLSVALGRPTCGLFVSTELARYGHESAPNVAISLQNQPRTRWLGDVRAFVEKTSGASRRPPHAARIVRRVPPDILRWPHTTTLEVPR